MSSPSVTLKKDADAFFLLLASFFLISMRKTLETGAVKPFSHLSKMPNSSVLNAGCAAVYKVKPE